MAYRLKSRVKPIPHGLKYFQSEIGWDSVKVLGRSPSWERLVTALIDARANNPAQRDKHKWSLDPATVADEVDAYNTKLCLDHGWLNYITGEGGAGPPPKPLPPSLRRSAGNAVAGSEVLVEWIASGAQAVPPGQSSARAAACAACPLNRSGDLLSWFTKPVSEAIRAAISLKNEWKLITPFDEQLGVCSACGCPMKLKVHVPTANIALGMSPAELSELHSSCWIPQELKSVNNC
jgi:hypothetical protein